MLGRDVREFEDIEVEPLGMTLSDRVASESHRHIIIERVQPNVDEGRFPAKRVVSDTCVVKAHIYRDGPQVLRAVVSWRPKGSEAFSRTPMSHVENDEWQGEFRLQEVGQYEFRIEAWTDEFATWQSWIRRKSGTGEDLRSDLLEGADLAAQFLRNRQVEQLQDVQQWIERIQSVSKDLGIAMTQALNPDFAHIFSGIELQKDIATSPFFELMVEPRVAQVGAWYELFPRSQGTDPTRGATLREAERRLSEIRDMGFDVLYLPPIHPVGVTNRKGRNNRLKAEPGDPGSPWQIGSTAGGHTAVEPALGTLADFDHFLATAHALGLQIALDFAAQCSPDHPWVTEHPDWFLHRPDGSIKYAENPPKKYQDIYPINFDTADEIGLWEALRQVVLFWINRGVSIFRVDNPHTKPVRFWAWLLAEVKREHPNIVFLAEAFTRPKMMKMLAKVGFSQSYTYFTWRNTKHEITEYLTELTTSDTKEYFRPNFFANTPDILPPILQHGGRPAFKMRVVLAATLSPTYGIYSGYELIECEAIAGTEEYFDSEKYQIKVRDWNKPGNIKEFIARINTARRDNPALHELTNIRFLNIDNDQLIAYVKATADSSNCILTVVNLDPFHTQEGTVQVPPDAIGIKPGTKFTVHDLLTGHRYMWSEYNYVRLDPLLETAHLLRVEVAT